MLAIASLVSLLTVPVYVSAAAVLPRAAPVALATSAVDALKPMAFFASAAYCSPDTTKDWTCGVDCDAVSEFIPVATGGDGSDVQFWFVGFHPPFNAVVVAHQGTNPNKFESLLTDAKFFLEPLDPTLFPNAPDGLKVHNGFADSQRETATDILASVRQAMAEHNATKVVISGHSLGAAIGVLDATLLKLNLPAGTDFEIATFGQPRVGNQAFADWIDRNFGGAYTRVTHHNDIIPTIPGRFLNFRHSAGEVHIQGDGDVVACDGQDSTAKGCTIDDVPAVFFGSIADHEGPYFGDITIGNCDDNLRRRSL